MQCFLIFQRVFRTSTRTPTPWGSGDKYRTFTSRVGAPTRIFKGHGSHTVISTACENSIALQLAKHKSFGSPNAKCNRLKIRTRKKNHSEQQQQQQLQNNENFYQRIVYCLGERIELDLFSLFHLS